MVARLLVGSWRPFTVVVGCAPAAKCAQRAFTAGIFALQTVREKETSSSCTTRNHLARSYVRGVVPLVRHCVVVRSNFDA